MVEILYRDFVDVYENLRSTPGRLEKTSILAKFLIKVVKNGRSELVYLLRGKVVADYDPRVLGISDQLAIKGISMGLGFKSEEIVKRYRKIGDLGEIAEEFVSKRRQSTLFRKKLKADDVFDNITKLMEIGGKGSVKRKLSLIADLLGASSGKEAKYVVRTLLGDLRVGVADGIMRDAIAEAFFEDEKKAMSIEIEKNYDFTNDFVAVLDAARKGKKEVLKFEILLGRPVKVMLPVKVNDIEEAFRIVGRPAAIEHKYDGFRVAISKDGPKINLFTRRLENVTKQFPDVVDAVKGNVLGRNFILDSEVVGYDARTKKYMPFEAISQRIKRKHGIDKMMKELPVEVNVFDILYYDGKSLLDEPFAKRRKIIEKIIKVEKMKIRESYQIVTGSDEEAREFYKKALKIGEEGVMFKKLDAPYHSGRRVGYIVKLKPIIKDMDLVIVGAEYGHGKRGGWLTSYIVACRSAGGKYLEVGKVSSGLKELEGDTADRKSAGLTTPKQQNEVTSGGTTYAEMSNLLKPLIKKVDGKRVDVMPKIIVSVTYQNIQKSPSYSSGYALRFPRITAYRPDRGAGDIATLGDVKKESQKGR